MSEKLTGTELAALVERVFSPRPEDRILSIFTDLPDEATPDDPAWKARRAMAADWALQLRAMEPKTGLAVRHYLFRNVRMNNADLPPAAHLHEGGALPDTADELDPAREVPTARVLEETDIILAPTRFSATAPLKLAAGAARLRAATMPGFTAAMIPALRLDYTEINRRVDLLKALVDRATGADLTFEVEGVGHCALHLDLRHRAGHASGGLFPEPGAAGNLPSGETYIVPYEGELDGDPSRTAGRLPVQFGEEVVVYDIVENRAVAVDGAGAALEQERDHLAREPAYGNLSELGLGVLADFGLKPIGEVLLDEKLGLHIAFGRSDHFGGQVGAGDFSCPEAVIHIDRVYLPETMPRISVRRMDLLMPDGDPIALFVDDRYAIDF